MYNINILYTYFVQRTPYVCSDFLKFSYNIYKKFKKKKSCAYGINVTFVKQNIYIFKSIKYLLRSNIFCSSILFTKYLDEYYR